MLAERNLRKDGVRRVRGKAPAGQKADMQNADTFLPEPSNGFVTTPFVEQISRRALTYLQAGYPIHFAGAAGTGKTTLAFHVAAQLSRAVSLIHGDDDFGSSDLVGQDSGYRKHKVIDNYIHSVVKTEEEMKSLWLENRLTTACQNGDTLIYDEFNRSRPEANNPFLSIFSEHISEFAQAAALQRRLPARPSAIPRHFHLQSRRIRGGSQNAGRLDGPVDNH